MLVEDTDDDAKNCTDSVDIMNEENADISIMIDVTKTVGEAIEKLKLNNYHGAIIDIKIDDGTDKSGNDVIKDIISTYRLPVAVMTATPGFKADEETNIPIYIKGEAKYKEIINELIEIDNTGLFDVLGGKGIIEKKMVSVFWNNIYPQLDTWRKYSTEGIDTESILLRYILAHLLEGLSEEGPAYCTEETYISLKGMENRLHTGDIFLHKDKCEYYILLSPPCDLALHDGKPKTETLMLCATLIYLTQLLYNLKHTSWSYEKEYRCIIASNAEGMPFIDAKPKAIYIGRDCSAKNADCLFDIADEHEAKIYKMDFNDYLNNYELVYKEFQK